MSDIRKKSLDLTKEAHKEMLKRVVFENKEFEKEAVLLFSEMFEKEELIQEEYDKSHPNESHGLDGGCTAELRRTSKEYFRRFDELKKKYGIEDI